MEVEEREIDEHGNICISAENASNERTPMIRDSSRNRLQRLGAMYSETENLSSPIHRNEARFDDETQADENRGKPTARLGKLAALASQISNWEDESSNSDGKSTKPSTSSSPTKIPPTIVGASPRKIVHSGVIPKQPANIQTKSNLSPTKKSSTDGSEKRPSKQLKWDKNVMDHLEQQGFQRRESTTSKLIYDYNEPKEIIKTAPDHDKAIRTTTETAKKTYISTAQITKVSDVKSRDVDNNKTGLVKNTPVVAKGLVSDRAARFESSKQVASQKSQKDPAEMSMKERLALFEKNKGTALIPKAALGMSVSAKQIMSDGQSPKQNTPEKPKINSFNKPGESKFKMKKKTISIDLSFAVFAESTASGSGIRNAVAALMSNATTISQSQISNDIRKQREKELNVVLSRFNRPIETTSSSEPDSLSQNIVQHMTPPPAPPMPSNLWSKERSADGKSHTKRKSNGSSPNRKHKMHVSLIHN